MICLYLSFSIIKVIHPVVALAMVMLVGVFVVIADQPIEDSMVYIVIIVTLALPMLIICLFFNFHGFG